MDAEFSHTKVMFRENGLIYYSRLQQKPVNKDDIRFEDLLDVTLIPVEAYRPPLRPAFTIANPTTQKTTQHYRKESDATSFSAGIEPKDYVLQEIAACELLYKNPHPNIARYHGCLATSGLVSALVFDKYSITMMDLLNPRHLNKAAFLNSRPALPETANYLEGTKAGILHLHSLNLVHNDLNPTNIMISRDGTPVIIDFDSCLPKGACLGKTKRTYGWYDQDVHVSVESNDLDALKELQTWLTGSSEDDFKFPM